MNINSWRVRHCSTQLRTDEGSVAQLMHVGGVGGGRLFMSYKEQTKAQSKVQMSKRGKHTVTLRCRGNTTLET